MKRFILLSILVCMFLTSCSANSNTEEYTLPTKTSETSGIETVSESITDESKITTSDDVSEIAEISETAQTTETSQTVLKTTETQKLPQNYDVESVPYKAACIVYNEYLEFQNGQFDEWWVNDKDNNSPHVCTKVLVFDLNGDGRQELISLKWARWTVCSYFTVYDLDSGEMLFNGYYGASDGKLYCKDGKYCLKLEYSSFDMVFVTVADKEFDNDIPDASALGYDEGYFYMGNKVNAIIYQYENLPFEGTEDSYCRRFSLTEGFTYYHGDYDTQIEQQERDFESNFADYDEIGELLSIREIDLLNDDEVDYSVDGIFSIHLLQRDITDFDALVERLSLYEE